MEHKRYEGYVIVSKRDYEKLIANKDKTEPKHFWSYVKSKTKSKSTISNLVKEDGSFTKTDKEKAILLNSFFASVFTSENVQNIPDIEDKDFQNPLDHFILSEETVKKCLLELNGSKSMGPDNTNM